jgi:putative DNA primase/helicase
VKKNSKLHSDFSNKEIDHLIESKNELVSVISSGTGRTGRTTANDVACSGSTSKNDGRTSRTTSNDEAGSDSNPFDLTETIEPLHDIDDAVMEKVRFDDLKVPCYIVKNDWFMLDGTKKKSGVYYCHEMESKSGESQRFAVRICSPLYVEAVTNTDDGRFFGRLLNFRDTFGHWRKWAMPMGLLRGSNEELRGELLNAGVEIEHRQRGKLPDYLQFDIPAKQLIAATRTGWTKDGNAYVFHDKVIGDENVFFQSESLSSDGLAKTGGSYKQWKAMAALCDGNPVLILSLCVSFSGALLAKLHGDSGGVHLVGDSSIGKTTALCVGASVWGGEDFKRTWRATSNGLEGVAALLSDSCLFLDEISEADPRDVGAIVYSLGNGQGKTRANRTGSARTAHRWRLSLLSTGERSIGAAMSEGGKQIKAGQEVRLLNVPAERTHGIFDCLHSYSGGRELSDELKTMAKKHYGFAGITFVEYLLKQRTDDLSKKLAELETQFSKDDAQSGRAATRFAIYALAGELAIDVGILTFTQGAALKACQIMFKEWQAARGNGSTEHKQILQSVLDYILKFGDTKFTDKSTPEEKPRLDRSGWYNNTPSGQVFMFTSAAIKEAGGNYDFKRVLDALDTAGWIADRDSGLRGVRSKKTSITRGSKQSLYWILPTDEEKFIV